MQIKPKSWDEPEHTSARSENPSSRQGKVRDPISATSLEKKNIWINPGLTNKGETANLDSQHPLTLYYLGRLIKIPGVVQIYVEQRKNGNIKHWAVLEDRDYELMDRIYEIEEDTLDKFPMADLNFRVTVFTEEGPSISANADKIYDVT